MRIATVLLLAVMASLAPAADYVVTPRGIWKIVDGIPVRQTGTTDRVVVFDGSTPTPNPNPDPNPDPEPGRPLADRVAGWADTVGEPAARTAFASLYKMVADRFTDWNRSLETIKQSRDVMLIGSTNREAWNNVFTNIDTALETEPKTADTLRNVAAGLERASALDAKQIAAIPQPLRGRDGVERIQWLKLIQCLPCIIDAFTGIDLGSSRQTKTKPVSSVHYPRLDLKHIPALAEPKAVEFKCCGSEQ